MVRDVESLFFENAFFGEKDLLKCKWFENWATIILTSSDESQTNLRSYLRFECGRVQ